MLDPVGDFIVEALARTYESYIGVRIQQVENATCCHLAKEYMSNAQVGWLIALPAYLAATDDKHPSIPHLPRENQGSTAFNLWILCHCESVETELVQCRRFHML